MKKINVLLVSTLTGEGSGYVKHGLGIISACLRKNGHPTMILNNPNAIKESIFKFMPDVIGIYGLSNSFHTMLNCAIISKKFFPHKPIFAGGVAATLSPEIFDEEPAVSLFDFVFCGEGEITFPDIIDHFSRTESLPDQRRIHGEVVHEIDSLPFVDRTGYENGESKHVLLENYSGPMFTMLNSRWCRKNCRFCAPASKTIFGGIKKLRSVNHFIAEIETLPRNALLMIHDDNMIENSEWAQEFVDHYQAISNPFICQAYPAEIVRSEKILIELKKVGLKGVLVGFESGSDRMLQHMRKGTTKDINIRAAKLLHKLDIQIQANLMFGSPTETYDEMMETVKMFNEDIHPAFPSPAIYTPYPGSYWYDELKQKGLISIKNHSQYERHANTRNKIYGVNYAKVRKAIVQLNPDEPQWKKILRFQRYRKNDLIP